jgi:hypothetical protein
MCLPPSNTRETAVDNASTHHSRELLYAKCAHRQERAVDLTCLLPPPRRELPAPPTTLRPFTRRGLLILHVFVHQQ